MARDDSSPLNETLMRTIAETVQDAMVKAKAPMSVGVFVMLVDKNAIGGPPDKTAFLSGRAHLSEDEVCTALINYLHTENVTFERTVMVQPPSKRGFRSG